MADRSCLHCGAAFLAFERDLEVEVVRLTNQNRKMLHFRLVPLIAFSIVGGIMGTVGMLHHFYPQAPVPFVGEAR